MGSSKFVPDLKNTPLIIFVPPMNVTEVKKCLSSVEERVGNREKMDTLKELQAWIYTSRTDNFHWRLSESLEMNGAYLLPGTRFNCEDSSSDESESEVADYEYMPNDYVAT